MLAPPTLTASRLLRTEHAVAEALLAAPSAEAAYPDVLRAIGEGLDWRYGGLWLPVSSGVLHCVATWTADPSLEPFAAASAVLELTPGEGVPGRVRASGRPAWIADVTVDPNFPRGGEAAEVGLHAAFAIPLSQTGGGVIEFLTSPVAEPDETLLATLASLGRQIGQFSVIHASEARKHAMLDAALDAVITIDHEGRIVELNAAVR